MQKTTVATLVILVAAATTLAAERSLVPDTASTVPDYFCTWNVQGFCASYASANAQADQMIEANLFGKGPNQNWLEFYPRVRADLTFLLDDAFDFPLGGGHNHPMRGNVKLHPDRFPSYQQGSPGEGWRQLSGDIKAQGWRDLGLWICNSRPNVEELPIDSNTYWCERLAWSQQAGIGNWKVDWGIGRSDKPLWKFKVTPEARRAAPDVWLEFGKQGDVYRTYDVNVLVSIPETIRRIATFLEEDAPDDHRLINCEDEVYVGAALATTYGVMRHPLVGNMPNGSPDGFFRADFRDVKRRMDEVVRAVRWHRIAQPTPKGGEYLVDNRTLTDFKSQPAPARITRGGLPLPKVTLHDGGQPPYVLAARHLDGEVGVATIPRNFEVDGRRTLTYPLADVVLEVGNLDRPVGIFGKYRSLTLVSTNNLAGKRILAQDLAGDTPVDITDEVNVDGGRLTLPGQVLHRVGLMAAAPGDISDPGLVLVVEGLTEYAPKKPMKPGMFVLSTSAVAGAVPTVRSPDGKVAVQIGLNNGQPRWAVSFLGRHFIEDGLLGVETAPDRFSGDYELLGTETASGDSTWKPVWGDLSEVPDRYNELTVKLKERAGQGRVFHVIVRAYDEGVGLRYHFPAQPNLGQFALKKRLTEYRFAANHTIYQCRNYEYGTVKIDSMSRSEGAVTVDLGNGSFAALTDADRSDFPVTFWHNAKDAPNTIVGRLHSDAVGQSPFSTSWEVLILGATAAKLYENRYLVENLNPPCAIEDTSWIRPGNKAICQVRNARMVTSELKTLADFASAHGIDYLEIDHSWCGAETKWTPDEIDFFEKNKSTFWDDKPEWRSNVGGNLFAPAVGWVPFRPKADSGGNFVDLDIQELAAYANGLDPKVGICVYVRGEVLKEFGGEHAIEDVFATYEKWGLAGVKPGFVPCSSQQHERTIASMVSKAAAHRLILCIHDAYLPSGLSRTYPNLVNIEGLAGEEAEHSIPLEMKSRHDVMLPFTRGLMGPLDYTPEFYKRDSVKTHCHQTAMLGVYPGRVSIRGGMRLWSPGGVGGPEIEFVEKLPGLFDEQRVMAELGEYVTVARRRGDTWFVASMSDGCRRTYSLPLDFLESGTNYRASIFTDIPGELQATCAVTSVSSNSVIEIDMQPNGGHLMILAPTR
ncbi:MAG: glycoside hydrolase family 97 N-terminal domain-containing protein [Pirellulaceae bacterium]|nr:glycoside hydrolase family 97 N-terminal domain-containing protein [Pirellulaceae bacterium]